MSDELRRSVIRLAHARPDLRAHLLPLVAFQTERPAWPQFDLGAWPGKFRLITSVHTGISASWSQVQRKLQALADGPMKTAIGHVLPDVPILSAQVQLTESARRGDADVHFWFNVPRDADTPTIIRQVRRLDLGHIRLPKF